MYIHNKKFQNLNIYYFRDSTYIDDDHSRISHESTLPLTTRSSTTSVSESVSVKNASISSGSASTAIEMMNELKENIEMDKDDDDDVSSDDDDQWPSDLSSMNGDMDEDARKWEIYDLKKQLRKGQITQEQYEEELRCLSPVPDDIEIEEEEEDSIINDEITEEILPIERKTAPSPSLECIPKLDFGNLRLEPSTELSK